MRNTWTSTEIDWMLRSIRTLAAKFRPVDIYDIEDIVQLAMIKALNKADRQLPTVGWLRATVCSVIADTSRARARRIDYLVVAPDVFNNVAESGEVTHEKRVDARIEHEKLVPLLHNIMSELSSEHREVVQLRIMGRSYKDIAMLTQTKIGTVRLHIRMNLATCSH